MLYFGPETYVPLASAAAALTGLILTFWRRLVGFFRRLGSRLSTSGKAAVPVRRTKNLVVPVGRAKKVMAPGRGTKKVLAPVRGTKKVMAPVRGTKKVVAPVPRTKKPPFRAP